MPISVPEGVSPHLVKELQRIQNQLVILANNQKILDHALERDPKNADLKKKMTWVEQYIVQFNDEQKPILTQIRAEVKALNEAKETQADDTSSTKSEPDPAPKSEPHSESEPAAPTSTAPSTDNEIKDEEDTKSIKTEPEQVEQQTMSKAAANSARKQAMIDRMAAVRGAKKNNKGKGGKAKGAKDKKAAERTPSPTAENGEDSDDWTKFVDPEQELKEGQYRAHIGSQEKFTADVYPYYDAAHDPVVFPIERYNTYFPRNPEKAPEEEKTNYFKHLALFLPSDMEIIEEVARKDRKRKFDYRNMTLIPEFTEKKQRFNYHWMSNDHAMNNFSPPRTRGGRGQKNQAALTELENTLRAKRRLGGASAPVSATATATPSGETSRASTPDTATPPKQEPAVSRQDSTVSDIPDSLIASTTPIKEEPKKEDSSEEAMEVIIKEEDVIVKEEPAVKEEPSPPPPVAAAAVVAPVRESKRSLVRDRQRAKLLKKKPAKEEELAVLVKKSEELRVVIEGNGLTVATRKERMKKTELSRERDTIEEKIAKLRQELAKFEAL